MSPEGDPKVKFFKRDNNNIYENYEYESKNVSGTNPEEFDDDSFTIPLDIFDSGITAWGKRSEKVHAPHALTRDELMNTGNNQASAKKIEMVPSSKKVNGSNISPAAQSLFEKMLKSQEQATVAEKSSQNDIDSVSVNSNTIADSDNTKIVTAHFASEPTMEKIQMKSASDNSDESIEKDFSPVSKAPVAPTEIKMNPPEGTAPSLKPESPADGKTDANKTNSVPSSIPMSQSEFKSSQVNRTAVPDFSSKQLVDEPIESLLKKCQNFINADDGMPTYKPTPRPAYTLDSVNDIISSAEKKAQERISRLYGDKKTTPENPAARYEGNTASMPLKPSVMEQKAAFSKPSIKDEKTSAVKSSLFVEKSPSVENIPMAPLVNIRKSRFFETPLDSQGARVSHSVAKEVPIKIKVIDSTENSDILTQTVELPAIKSETLKTVSDSTSSDVIKNIQPENQETMEKKAADKIQFSLADESIVNQPTSVDGSTREIGIENHVKPTHALFERSKIIKSELLDEINNDFGQTIDFAPVEKAVEPPKKINLFGNSDEDDDDNDAISDYDDELEDSIDDYTCLDDAPAIRIDLLSRREKLIARMIPTALITIILLVMNSSLCSSFASDFGAVWSWVQFGLLLIASVININTMKGLGGLFTLNPDMDSPAALAVLAVIVQSGLSIWLFGGTNNQLCAVATLALLFNSIGKFLIISRVIKGFSNIATSNIKRAIQFVKNDMAISAMSRGAIDGEALICVGRRTVNITGFLNNSYREDPYERAVPKIIISSLCLSLVGGLLGFLFAGTLSASIMSFVLFLCLCCPPSSLLLCNLPLKVAANTLKDYNTTLAGFSSASQIADCNAVAINVLDIFPAGSVKLFKMHLLSANAVDHSLMEAAAVAVGAKSPLVDIFKQILASDINNLPQVDAITYEDKMGLSGWIGERRILVGNRTLMEGHGIKLPSIEVDKKILRNGFFPVYIACDSKPCVLLVVGYEADEDITYEIRRLCSTGVTILVNSCDPNVTEQMICDYFGLFDDSIKLMSSSAIQLYKQETNYSESTKAPACFGDSICGFFAAVTASIRIKTISAIMAVLHIIGIFAGISIAVYMLSSGQIQSLTSLSIVIFQLVCTMITAIVPYLKRP